MDRRRFLKMAAAASAAAAAGLGLVPGRPARRARADTGWGAFPEGLEGLAIPASRRPKSVLEVFVAGGLSPWETFYTMPYDDYGKADGAMWWTFKDGPDSVMTHLNACGGLGGMAETEPFAADALGKMVHFGPLAAGFRARADIVARTRMVVNSHDLYPHDAATALATTGVRMGQPRLAGLAAAIQHHHQAGLAAAGQTSGDALLPAAYVIGEQRMGTLVATGYHPPSSRPIALQASRVGQFAGLLQQVAHTSEGTAYDELLDHYTGRYAGRLRAPTGSKRAARTLALDDYRFALEMRRQAGSFAQVMGQVAVEAEPYTACDGVVHPVDYSKLQYSLAAQLLRQPQTRYVAVADISYTPPVSDPIAYDAHVEYSPFLASKLPYLWARLTAAINEPGEGDPGKIDLDDTLIILNTEFGRTPWMELGNGSGGKSPGRNHYPTAYPTLLIGGPIGEEQRGVVGAIDAHGLPVDALHPVETRAAVLAALGIFPFAASAYSSSEVHGAADEGQALEKLRDTVLGLGVGA